MRKRFVEWLKKVRPTKRGIIEWLIEKYLPGYHLHRDPTPKITGTMTTLHKIDGSTVTVFSPLPEFTADKVINSGNLL